MFKLHHRQLRDSVNKGVIFDGVTPTEKQEYEIPSNWKISMLIAAILSAILFYAIADVIRYFGGG